MPASPGEVSREEIRAQLQRMLGSQRFAAAGRQRRFLEFIGGKVLAGEQDEIKEYLIALEVYERKPDYDPKVDSIVRVEASRVRARLKEYYENEGKDDLIVVELPKGSYIPVFRHSQLPIAPPPEPEPVPVPEPAVVDTRPARRNWSNLYWVGAVVLVAGVLIGVDLYKARPKPIPGPQTITIPPFTNLSHAQNSDAMAKGLAKEVETELTQGGKIRVLMHNRGGQETGPRADLILEGTIRDDGGHPRILVQLMSSRDGGYIWSQVLTEDGETNTGAVARSIARDTEQQAIQYAQERSAEGSPRARALQLYRTARGVPPLDMDGMMLRGTVSIEPLNLTELNKAISLLEQAVAADASLATAHSALSNYYQVASEYDARMVENARASAKRAIALEPQMGEAHANLGYIYFFLDWNMKGAEEEFRQALEFEPRILKSYRLGADVQSILGKHDEALKILDRARRVYPNHPLVETSVAVALFNAGRFWDAEKQAGLNLSRFPDFHLSHWVHGIALGELGKVKEGIAELEQCLKLSKGDTRCSAGIGYLYGKSGMRKQAEELLAQYRSRPATQSKARYAPAMIYNALGETEQAYTELEAAVAAHEADVPYARIEPRFANLRGQKRFQDLLRKAGI